MFDCRSVFLQSSYSVSTFPQWKEYNSSFYDGVEGVIVIDYYFLKNTLKVGR